MRPVDRRVKADLDKSTVTPQKKAVEAATPNGAYQSLVGGVASVIEDARRTALPDEALLVAEIDRARDEINARNGHLAATLGECK